MTRVLSGWTVSFGMSDFSVQMNELDSILQIDNLVLNLPHPKPSPFPSSDSSRYLGRYSLDS